MGSTCRFITPHLKILRFTKFNRLSFKTFCTNKTVNITMSNNPTNENASNSGKRDHLQVTSNSQRNSGIYHVKITKICNLSPTVKDLQLCSNVLPAPFTFQPGQWVDVFIPGVNKVGGFSMTSHPSYLRETGNLHLAVKYSDHPPARWVHSQNCTEGCDLSIRVGGDFFLDVTKLKCMEQRSLLFIAGGVGINPLASMIGEIHESKTLRDKVKAALLFSAKTFEELLFRDKFDALEKEAINFKPQYFLTGENDFQHSQDEQFYKERISLDHLERTIKAHLNLNPNSRDIGDKLLAYICGPPEMITYIESSLKSLGVNQIYYENWWQ